jgi:hypothetical protein
MPQRPEDLVPVLLEDRPPELGVGGRDPGRVPQARRRRSCARPGRGSPGRRRATDASTCGRWLMWATISSCLSGSIGHDLRPEVPPEAHTRRRPRVGAGRPASRSRSCPRTGRPCRAPIPSSPSPPWDGRPRSAPLPPGPRAPGGKSRPSRSRRRRRPPPPSGTGRSWRTRGTIRSTGAAITTKSAPLTASSGVSHVALHQACSPRASLVSGRLAQTTILRATPRPAPRGPRSPR